MLSSIVPMAAAAMVLLASKTIADSNLNVMYYQGCYSDGSVLKFENRYIYQTSGYCQPICVDANYAVLATTNKTDCYCGHEIPANSTKVDDSKCNDGCAGYGSEECGAYGAKYFSVYTSGLIDNQDVPIDGQSGVESSSSSSTTSSATKSTPSPTTTQQPSVVTVGGQTIIVTASSQVQTSSASNSSSGGGTNTAAIAAGVVVGVVAIAAIVGGIFFYMRQKKRRAVEEEYRRNAAANSFINGGKPGSSAGTSDFSDARLDPVMLANRRLSDGSIADDQDYSRRILKVINA